MDRGWGSGVAGGGEFAADHRGLVRFIPNKDCGNKFNRLSEGGTALCN